MVIECNSHTFNCFHQFSSRLCQLHENFFNILSARWILINAISIELFPLEKHFAQALPDFVIFGFDGFPASFIFNLSQVFAIGSCFIGNLVSKEFIKRRNGLTKWQVVCWHES